MITAPEGKEFDMCRPAPCPFCGREVHLVRATSMIGGDVRYGIDHDCCQILPTVWGAWNVGADTLVRCWNQRYGVANLLRLKGADGLADEMAFLG